MSLYVICYRQEIIEKLLGQVVRLSQHKFASNVIEKCLQYGDSASRQVSLNLSGIDAECRSSIHESSLRNAFASNLKGCCPTPPHPPLYWLRPKGSSG